MEIRLTGALPDPAFWHGKRVLLTGHTGFKGAWLALWLRRLGAEVTGFSLPPEGETLYEAAGIGCRMARSLHGDLRDAATAAEAVRSADPHIILHLAAQALVRRSYQDPVGTLATNVLGTAHVLAAASHAPSLRAVVVVTSDKCYENREWAWAYRESDPLGGHDIYSASKACTELVAAAWRRSFLHDAGFGVATARAGNVVGGGDWSDDRLVPDCVRAFRRSQPVALRNPHATRPWQHVLEPLCGYLLLAERLAADPVGYGEAFNFGPPIEDVQPVSAVVDMLARSWGEGATWTAAEGEQLHEAGILAVDAALARARLGWRPRLRLRDALQWTSRWYRRHAAGEDAAALLEAEISQYETTGAAP